jgi:glycerate kinase
MGDKKDPLHATTKGVGELIKHAAAKGSDHILMGIGGSATNDGGIGMAASLGYRFLNEDGAELVPLAINLGKIRHIEQPDTLPDVAVTVACDVDNPLCGPHGAAYTFGRQKGADDAMLAELDAGLKNLASVIRSDLGVDVLDLPGAGAAGGLGAGLSAFLSARLVPGIDLILDAAHFDDMIKGTDIVFTGEGRIDWQSVHGKVPVGVARRAKAQSIPCVALCGAIGENMEKVYDYGITAAFSAVRGAMDFEEIKRTCREDLRMLAVAVMRLMCSKEL